MALTPHLNSITHPCADKTMAVAKVGNKMQSGEFPLLDPKYHGSYQELCKYTQDVFGIYSDGDVKGMPPDKKAVLSEVLVQLIQHNWDTHKPRCNAIHDLRCCHPPILPEGFVSISIMIFPKICCFISC